MNFKETLERHPAPWNYTTINGVVIVTDAAGAQVPLFTILDFVRDVTAGVAKAAQRAG